MVTVPGPDRSREERLNAMMLTYEREVLKLCCMYLRDTSLAQDAVQETFLKAYRKLDTFQGRASERTWLMRIAINTCKDMRKSAWFRYVDHSVSLDMLPEPVSPPEVEHIALTTAIMGLKKKYMEVVLLHYYQGMNVKETAEVLGISPPAVVNRLNKARAKLRDALGGEEA